MPAPTPPQHVRGNTKTYTWQNKELEKDRRPLEVSTLSSSHHIEFAPADAGTRDREAVSCVLKDVGASPPLDGAPFKVVLLTEVERLSRQAQFALRRLMEKSAKNLRLIMVTENLSRVAAPIRSRCVLVRVRLAEVL